MCGREPVRTLLGACVLKVRVCGDTGLRGTCGIMKVLPVGGGATRESRLLSGRHHMFRCVPKERLTRDVVLLLFIAFNEGTFNEFKV